MDCREIEFEVIDEANRCIEIKTLSVAKEEILDLTDDAFDFGMDREIIRTCILRTTDFTVHVVGSTWDVIEKLYSKLGIR